MGHGPLFYRFSLYISTVAMTLIAVSAETARTAMRVYPVSRYAAARRDIRNPRIVPGISTRDSRSSCCAKPADRAERRQRDDRSER